MVPASESATIARRSVFMTAERTNQGDRRDCHRPVARSRRVGRPPRAPGESTQPDETQQRGPTELCRAQRFGQAVQMLLDIELQSRVRRGSLISIGRSLKWVVLFRHEAVSLCAPPSDDSLRRRREGRVVTLLAFAVGNDDRFQRSNAKAAAPATDSTRSRVSPQRSIDTWSCPFPKRFLRT